MKETCQHIWLYDGKSCCYRLRCSKCDRIATAYYVDGPMPNKGDPVKLDGETIEVVGSQIQMGGNG